MISVSLELACGLGVCNTENKSLEKVWVEPAMLPEWVRREQSSNAWCKPVLLPVAGEAESLRKHSWLVLVCESRIRLQDLNSEATHDIPRAVLENKIPTCAAILYYNSSKLVAGDHIYLSA